MGTVQLLSQTEGMGAGRRRLLEGALCTTCAPTPSPSADTPVLPHRRLLRRPGRSGGAGTPSMISDVMARPLFITLCYQYQPMMYYYTNTIDAAVNPLPLSGLPN